MGEFPKGGIIGKTVHLWRRVSGFRVPLYAANASFFIVLAVFPALLLLLGLLRFTPLEVERDGLIDKLTVVQTEFDFDFGEITDPTDELIEAYDTQRRNMAALYNRYAYIKEPTSYICEKFRQAIAKAKEDCDKIINPEG